MCGENCLDRTLGCPVTEEEVRAFDPVKIRADGSLLLGCAEVDCSEIAVVVRCGDDLYKRTTELDPEGSVAAA